MNPEMARQIADTVVRDTQFWIALIGTIGGIVGALIALLSSVLLHWLQGRKANALDRDRNKLLRELLEAQAAIAGGHAARSLLSGMSTNTATLLLMTGLAVAGAPVLVLVWPAQSAACTSVATALRSD